MMWLFRQKRVKPAIVSTDTVIPLHFFDDTVLNRAIVMDLTLRFDDVLSPEKIQNALIRLMELGNWRKLGARLRMNEMGKLEYHVPVCYNEERPGFSYTHVNYSMRIEEHSLAAQLPKASARPSVHVNPEHFKSLSRRSDAPKKLDDYISSDEPQISLHIVSFEDSTLISLTWPHTFFDALGRAALFNAWTLVLNGQEDQVPPFHGFETDPLATLGSLAAEDSVLASRSITGFSILLFLLRYYLELFWWPKEDCRIVCLPSSYLRTMKQTAMQELATEDRDGCKLFVSEGDLVCSWWARLALQHLGPTSNRTVVIMNMFGLRELLAKDLLPAGTAYISNAFFSVYHILPAFEIFQRPLSFVGSQIRRSIQEQGTRGQVEAFAALSRRTILETGRPAIFGNSSTQLLIFSNCTKAKFHEVDFSSAVVKQGLLLEKRVNALGRPSYLHVSSHMHGLSGRYLFFISGKDAAGNYWLSGSLRASTWQKIEEDFAAT